MEFNFNKKGIHNIYYLISDKVIKVLGFKVGFNDMSEHNEEILLTDDSYDSVKGLDKLNKIKVKSEEIKEWQFAISDTEKGIV